MFGRSRGAHESTPKEAITNGARQGAFFLATAGFLFTLLTGNGLPLANLPFLVLALLVALLVACTVLPLGPAIVAAAMTKTPLTFMLRKIGGYEALVLGYAIGLAAIVGLLIEVITRSEGPSALVLTLVSWLGMKMFFGGKRMIAPTAWDLRRSDKRRPVMALRSFRDDRTVIQEPWILLLWPLLGGSKTSEEIVVRAFSSIGPVIAVGHPRELFPPVGAGRLWLDDLQWKERVLELLHESQYAVLLIGYLEKDDGLAWELDQLVALNQPERTVLLIPPVNELEAQLRWEQYVNRLPKRPSQVYRQ